MKQVLDVLQDSTIASKDGKDNRSRFWGVYKRVAEEHDSEFLERYTGDMDIVLVFSGLFSAVSTSFIVAMESNLSPDPSHTTNALLKQIVYIGLGNLAAAGSIPAEPTWSPATSTLRIQMVAYASLSMSLLAAFGAVLGKQWLGYYKSNRYGRGSQEERGKRRQAKFDGLVTWYFDAVVQSFPVLLQISLLLFGIALGANMWYEQPSIAWVIIATTVFGFLFYSLTVMACLISPACPFQTPMSTVLRMLGIHKVLLLTFEPASMYFQQLKTPAHAVLQRMLDTFRSRWTQLSEALRGPVRATGTFARGSLQLLLAVLHKGLRSLVLHPSTNNVDSEAQPLDQDLDVLPENEYTLTLNLPHIPTSDLEAPSIKWLLETSTDPEVLHAAASFVPQVEWPLCLNVSDMLYQLSDIFTSCVDSHRRIVPSFEARASACAMALIRLYHGRILQAYPSPGDGDFIGSESRDFSVFFQMNFAVKHTILSTTMRLSLSENSPSVFGWSPPDLETPDPVSEWLSHCLPYNFVTGRVDKSIEKLAIAVISKLLRSPSSPSNQIIANCTLLACVMVGVQFDKKDIVRIDKSSALPEFLEVLLWQFQKVLWAWDGGDFSRDSTGVTRRAWGLLDIICCILDFTRCHNISSSSHMRNLDVCRRIYSRVRSSEQNDPSVSLATLRNVLHFTFAAVGVSRSPVNLWNDWYLQGGSHSPEDFDWLVDYLDYIYSDDHEVAYNILLLLGGMGVSCSPAKQHVFIERLIPCMDSNMPPHLRHAALRAAHSAREELASIDAMDDARLRDMVLTKLSPAIMSAICPHTTPADSGPDSLFRYFRDLCYLEIVFALARNLNWHPHLSGDRHIDRCISMIPHYCVSRCRDVHAFYIAGILLRIASEQTSDTILSSVTEQQWWDVMRSAWNGYFYEIYQDLNLLVLVDGTKKWMHIASKSDLEQLVGNVDQFLEHLEGIKQEQRRLQGMRPEVQGLEQQEGIVIANVTELRTAASNMLESFDQQLSVP
jgi:hypothetical protein